MNEFAGQVILVTGGTRGIGRACASAFARDGGRVAICGRNAQKAGAAAEDVQKETGGEVRGFEACVNDPAAVDRLVQAVTDAFGPISVLVNNAGIVREGLILRMKDEDWAEVIATDLSGIFYCCRAVSRSMVRQRYGRIVNISSVIGLRGQAGQTNYAAAKAGIIGFTKSLAQELASRNVTVNAVAPGYIKTDMTARFTESMRAAVLERIPLGREGTCEEVAAVVRFLANGAASYITGAVLSVDGGLGM